MGEILLETICEMKGRYPDIPLPFARDELPPDAFFVTLPIGKVDAVSGNGRHYPRSAIESVVDCINEMANKGWWGHPKPADRAERPPAVQCLAAAIEDDGTAWGKFIAIDEAAAKMIQLAKLTNSKIGTSIYGEAVMEADRKTVKTVSLEYIDLLSEGKWGGVPVTAAVPVLTSEMSADATAESFSAAANSTDIQEIDPMSENTTLTLTTQIQELAAQRNDALRERDEIKAERDSIKQQLATAVAQLEEMGTKVTELEQLRDTLNPAAEQADAIRQLIAETADLYTRLEINVSGYGSDLAATIRDVIAKLQSLSADQLMAKMDAAVTEMVPLAEMRSVVREMLGTVHTEADIKARIETILSNPAIQALSKKLAVQETGPNALTAARSSEIDPGVARAIADAEKTAERMGRRSR